MSFQFDSLAAFLQMEGHGFFVWTGYLVTLAVMFWLVFAPVIKHRQVVRQLNRELRRREANQNNRETD